MREPHGEEGEAVQGVRTPSVVQLCEAAAVAAASSLKNTRKVCPLERTSKDGTR